MNCHLVPVEVGIESLADERVHEDRIALDQNRLESLNSHPVQRRSSVQKNRVPLSHLLEDVPDLVILPLEHLLRALDGIGVAEFLQPPDDEGLEKFEGDLLRQSALVELELGSNRNN